MRNLVAILIAGVITSLGICSVWWINTDGLSYEYVLAWFPFIIGVGVLTYQLLMGSSAVTNWRVLHWFGSAVIGILLLHPVAFIFDLMKWSILNTWAIAHGMFMIAIPLFIVSVFWIIQGIVARGVKLGIIGEKFK